jgi:putative ABC transport system permease protein
LESLLQDIRYGARILYRSPGFAAVAVLSLALVIAVNSTVFSVVNAMLFQPFPYEEPNRLVQLSEVRVDRPNRWRNPPLSTFIEWTKQAQSFEQMALAAPWQPAVTISARGHAEPGLWQRVSPTLFPLLGVQPQLGRVFTSEDVSYEPGEPVIISDTYWRRRFDADPNVLGERLLVAGQVNTIIGVMPPGFWVFPNQRETHVWQHFKISHHKQKPNTRWQVPLARLKPDVSVEQARLELDAITRHLQERESATEKDWRVNVELLPDMFVAGWKRTLYQLFVIALFVLLIGCANVANMLLARARSREKEISIRISLGASRLRLMRQLLTESILLSSLGGVGGLFLTIWGIGVFVALAPEGWSIHQEEISVDIRVIVFAAVISVLTGVLFGLAPALRTSRPNLYESLKEGGRRSAGAANPRIGGLLIVSEISLAVALLVGAGLMVNSFVRLQHVDPGFDPSNLLTVDLFLQGPQYWEWIEGQGNMRRVTSQADQFWEELREQTEALPGVQSAAVGSPPWISVKVQIVGQASTPQAQQPWANYQAVSPGYFHTLGIPLLRGNNLTEQDEAGSRWVALINETMAQRFFPNEDPLGKLIRLEFSDNEGLVRQEPHREIVGVIGDVRQWRLVREPMPTVYTSQRQHLSEFPGMGALASVVRKTLLVRTASRPMSLKPAVESIIREIDSDQAPAEIFTQEQLLSESIDYWRFWMRLFLSFAGVAVILTVVGIFGIIAYAVSERTHEIGVRMAMGALKQNIFTLVIKQGLKLTLIGLAAGIGVSLALTRWISTFLYEVSPTDPLTYGIVSLLLIGVAMAACYFPARWATKVDPLVALRHE